MRSSGCCRSSFDRCLRPGQTPTVWNRRVSDESEKAAELAFRHGEKSEKADFFDEKRFNSSTVWKDLKSRVKGKPLLEQLDIINRFWNLWPYRTDKEVYGKQDYWAAPYEFLAKSGDCEDYCIIKYYTLKELGIPVEKMRIVVVRETIRNIGHAVLAVYDGDDVYILDNLSDAVRPMERIRNYVPQFSVNEKYRWVHVKARQ